MTQNAWFIIYFIMMLVMGLGIYRILCSISDVVMHTNSMKDALVKVTGEKELARGRLLGKEETNAGDIGPDQIERTAQAVAVRVADIVVERLVKDERFKKND